MIVHASKTPRTGGDRVCPIFPELRPYLEAAWDTAPDGAVFVVHRCGGRSSTTNLRTYFEGLIAKAGLVQWPTLFQNLRPSRETELVALYPAKDVSSWLGNSVPVAMAHYAMAIAESFQRARLEGAQKSGAKSGAIFGSIAENGQAIEAHQDKRENPESQEKSRVSMSDDGSTASTNGNAVFISMGGTELESVTSTMSTLRSNQLS